MAAYSTFVCTDALVYLLVPERSVRTALQVAVGLAAALAFLAASRTSRSKERLPWILLAAGFALWAVAGGAWHADGIFPFGYPLLLLGAIRLVRRTRAASLDILLDAAIIAAGCGLCIWVGLIAPSGHGASFATQASVGMRVTFGLALLAVFTHLAAARETRRLFCTYAFVGAAALLVAADCGHALHAVAGTRDPAWVQFGWLAASAIAGLGALHPSSMVVSSVRLPALGPGLRRLAVLGGATLTAPLGLAVGEARGGTSLATIAVWGAVIVILLFLRMALLSREQHRTQSALHDALGTLASAQDLAQIGGWTSGYVNGQETITMSSACRRIFGLPPGESVTTFDDFLALVHPDDRARVAKEDAAVAASGGRLEVEYRILRPDGEVRWIFDRGDFVSDAAAHGFCINGIVQDVTERRRSDAAAVEAEVRYRTLVEQLPLVSYVSDGSAEAPVVYISPQVEQLLGYPTSTWRDDPAFYAKVVHEADRERRRNAVERFEWDGGRFECEYRTVAADGRIVWVLDEMVRVPGGGSRPDSYQGFLVDITERKEAEARYRTLVEQLPLVGYVCALTAGTSLVYMSPQIEQLVGYTAEECVADADLVRRLTHPDDVELVAAEVRRVRSEFTSFAYDYRLIARDGHTVWVHDEMVVVRDELGEPVCFQGFLMDISARKELEEQLQQSQRMDVVGRLAGGIAHDFNNLLTAINGYTGFALERIGGLDPLLRNDLEQVKAAAERATSLTQQLLAFSRRQVLQPRPVELATVVDDVRDLLARLIGEDVELVTIADPKARPALADPGRLEQVLVNLAVNAREAMPAGGKLTIETRDVLVDEASPVAAVGAPPGRYAALVVRDTGLGMDAGTLSLAFEPFFTTKEVGEGSGLGLSTVYGIVTQSGGWITIDSEPGIGTEVTVFLPETDAAPVAAPPETSEPEAGWETVLLVEDEAIVRALVAEMLERRGYTVVQAPGPHEAMAMFDDSPCDLLVTDVVMPHMNGRELARRLREQKPELKVVYTSGYTADRVLEGGGLEDGEHFLQKPFPEDALNAIVREALNAVPA